MILLLQKKIILFIQEKVLLQKCLKQHTNKWKNNLQSKQQYKKINFDITNEKDVLNIKREIKAHSAVKHPNVIEFFSDELRDNKVFIILELAENGNLFNFLKKLKHPLTNEQVRKIYKQICEGVLAIHRKGIVHRDLKPENILLNGDLVPKICDFGWSTEIGKTEDRGTFCGTYEYMAPEIYENEKYNGSVDVWSLGILLYEIYHGRSPFSHQSVFKIYKNIVSEEIQFNNDLDPRGKHLIQQCLNNKPEERPTVAQILQHAYFTNQDFDEYLAELENKGGYQNKKINRDDLIDIIDGQETQNTTITEDKTQQIIPSSKKSSERKLPIEKEKEKTKKSFLKKSKQIKNEDQLQKIDSKKEKKDKNSDKAKLKLENKMNKTLFSQKNQQNKSFDINKIPNQKFKQELTKDTDDINNKKLFLGLKSGLLNNQIKTERKNSKTKLNLRTNLQFNRTQSNQKKQLNMSQKSLKNENGIGIDVQNAQNKKIKDIIKKNNIMKQQSFNQDNQQEELNKVKKKIKTKPRQKSGLFSKNGGLLQKKNTLKNKQLKQLF